MTHSHLIYCDESGQRDYGPKTDDYFVVAGAVASVGCAARTRGAYATAMSRRRRAFRARRILRTAKLYECRKIPTQADALRVMHEAIVWRVRQ